MNIQKIKKSDIKFEYIQNGVSLILKLFKIKNTSFEYDEQETLYSTFYTLLTTKEFSEQDDDYYIYGLFNEDNEFINFIPYERYDELSDVFKRFRVFLSIFLHNNQEEFPIQEDIVNKIEFPKKLYDIESFESYIVNYVLELNEYKSEFSSIFDDMDLETNDFINRFVSLESSYQLQVPYEMECESEYKLLIENTMTTNSQYSLRKEF